MPNKKSKRTNSQSRPKTLKEPKTPQEEEEMEIIANGEIDNATEDKTLTAFNVPERIILVIDRACDEVFSYFELNDGTNFRPLQMLKNVFNIFVHNKHYINKKHEFALIVLNESNVSWVLNFTSDIYRICEAIRDLEECETEDIFDLNSLFEVIDEKVRFPEKSEDLQVPTEFIVRVVFSYARSFTIPTFDVNENVKKMLNSPNFYIDVIMTHEIPDSSNKCELIFKKLEALNVNGKGYFYYVGRNSAKLHYAMGKICGNPLQRPLQKN